MSTFSSCSGTTRPRVVALVVMALASGLILLGFAPDSGSVAVPERAKAGDLVIHRCDYATEDASQAADCGALVVPQNQADPQSRLIALPVIRLGAQSDQPAEPVVYLEGGPGITKAEFLIGGVAIRDVPADLGGPFLAALAQTVDRVGFVLPPLPNMLFSRDNTSWIFQGVTLNPMYWPARGQETLLTTAVYRFHPAFADEKFDVWLGDFDAAPVDTQMATLEGGDVMPIGKGIVVIGMGERSRALSSGTTATSTRTRCSARPALRSSPSLLASWAAAAVVVAA